MGNQKEQRVEKAKKKFGRNQQILGCIRAGWAKNICRRPMNGDNGERKSGSGRPRKSTPREDRYLVTEALKTRDSSEVCPTAGDLAKALTERSSTKISPTTVQRRLRRRNIKKCAKTKAL